MNVITKEKWMIRILVSMVCFLGFYVMILNLFVDLLTLAILTGIYVSTFSFLMKYCTKLTLQVQDLKMNEFLESGYKE